MKAIVLGSTRGIGKAIAESLKGLANDLVLCGRKDIDTADLASVKQFIKKHPKTDILILNTGGPAAMEFNEITEEDWLKYFNQLFLSFVLLLKGIKVNDGGYVFLISSYVIKEPERKLIASSSLRLGFSSVFKSVSKLNMERNVSYINIAPGPTKTDRLISLLKNSGQTIEEWAKTLPTKRISEPREIGDFVRCIVEKRIKALNGVTINFDMGLSNYVL